MSNKITFDAELILEKHCPSMSTLYLDDEGKKFRSRIVAAMKEYASLQTEVKETEKTAFDFLKANGIIRQLDTRVEVIQCNYLGLINVMNEYAVHYKNRVSKPESEESQTEKIICAAVWFQDGQTTYIHQPKNISSGYVVAGRRHHNCFTLHAMLTGVGQKAESVQGFLTDTDRFVDRKEAMEIAKQSGQVPKSQSFEELYSEDLY